MTSELSRRHFLFGTVGTVAGAGLVLTAPDMQLFKPTFNETLAIMRKPVMRSWSHPELPNPAMCTIWFADGTTYTFEVAEIDVTQQREIFDVMTGYAQFEEYVPGLNKIQDIRLRPSGPVTIGQR